VLECKDLTEPIRLWPDIGMQRYKNRVMGLGEKLKAADPLAIPR